MTEDLSNVTTTETAAAKPRMPLRTRLIFFLVAWAIVLMPFYFWRATWFGRELTGQQMTEYLHDDAKPRHIQHALVQVGNRMVRKNDAKDANPRQWYPDLLRLATHPVEEIRTTDAWVMGQDPSQPEFHQALLGMLNDRAVLVRYNAALSLVSFGDASGRPQIAAMLRPLEMTAPLAGRVVARAKPGDAINHSTVLMRIEAAQETTDVRSPIVGRVRAILVAGGQEVRSGDNIAVLEPGVEQAWEALRALYLVGTAEDLDLVRQYKKQSPDYPDRVRQQAELAEQAIMDRAKK
ncbi:MAG: acetyl-CoA carboxylase biotin carboxyl carrier protein subunit [Candidatus Koribacter versatilis]|uniref:Acetyl-CoA carboxylase biotin carboxyl carrier protein subunit n=1 Tax=Candidatus Korobacter versatilis TaxID=658062 RepID=A0A932EN74_9BACT|nr:acetyl-CoA carboxylase biotin carboxyl carrier protein subunit [Candidatus Koribacter versatilis]